MLTRIHASFVAAFLAIFASRSASAVHETLLADFESTEVGGWVFSNGPEFPGARGSLAALTTVRGGSARLNYDVSDGGNYVSATLELDPPVTTEAFALLLRTPIGTKAWLRVRDATGQILQYDIVRPIEGSLDAAAWYRSVVEVAAPTSHFGGANDGVPHAPFDELSVLAVPDKASSGFVDFDDVVAISGTDELTLTPESMPIIPAPPDSEDLGSRLGVTVHTTNGTPGLDLAKDAGFSIVRIDLLWQHRELSKGVYDFTEIDAFVNALHQRGLRLHLILDYGNPLYPKVNEPGFSTVTIPPFAAMARTTAQRLAGKGVTYEVWNEPNAKLFWPADATLYAELCQAAVDAVHAGDPNAKVTTGGISGFDLPFLRTVLERGGVVRADAVGVHPYRKLPPETVGPDLLRMQNLLAASMSTPPAVWDTEWGYSSTWEGNGHGTNERKRHAQLVARELISAWSVGFPLIVYYDLRDDGTDPLNPEHNFGLLQNDYTDKPAMVAVKALTRAARGRRYVGLLQTGLGGVHAMRLDGTNDVVFVLWSENRHRDALIHLRSDASVVDHLGTAVVPATNGQAIDLTVREADGPYYVTFPRASNAAGAVFIDPAGGSDPSWGGNAGVNSFDPSGGQTGNGAVGKDAPAAGCGCVLASRSRNASAGHSALLMALTLMAFRGQVSRFRGRHGPGQARRRSL